MSSIRRTPAWMVLLALLCSVLLPATATSQWGPTRFYGCLNCVSEPWGITGTGGFVCEQVGHEETGEGIVCDQWEIWYGYVCDTGGGECFNVNVPYEEPENPEPEGGY